MSAGFEKVENWPMFRFSVVSNQISFIQKLLGSMNNLMNCTFLYLRVHDHDAWNNLARLLILQNELLILRNLITISLF